MAILKTLGLVLNRYDVRETTILVNFFTPDYGKITGELKGIRKDPTKFGSTVEIFSLNDIVYYEKRTSDIHLVSQCDLNNNFTPIRQNLAKITHATMMVELINAIMAVEDKQTEIFNLAVEALNELCTTNNPDKISTIFKIKVLSMSGFKPHLDSCVSCGGSVFNQGKFSLNLGGLLCERCHSKDLNSRMIFRGTVATILHIEKNDLKNNLTLGMNPQIKTELNMVLNAFLNYHLGKELKSQKSINKLESASAFK